MFAYYRTSSYSTVVNRILRGSITSADPSDLVLVKGNSFEWCRIGSVTENNPTLLEQQLEQSSFGTISDARLLTCNFRQFEQDQVVLDLNCTNIPYSKHTRHHSVIEGEDIIVAISEYGKLVFLTIVSDLNQQVNRFETVAEIYLESPGIEYTHLSKKLATDPHGRAIAVASFQDRFDIFIMNKAVSRTYFDPVIGRGSEYEQGIIWHMEFLYTKEDSMDRILLVLVVYNDVEKLCRLNLYAIDASDLENVKIEKASRLPLEKNTPLPVLLVPLKFRPESFMLVTEQQVCLLTADDLACGNVLYPTSIIPRPFGSTECPLFTSFALHLDASKEFIFLGSAEGCLFKLHVQSSNELVWEAIEAVPTVGQAMCMLGTIDIIDQYSDTDSDSIEQVKADLVMVTGETTDHLLLSIPHHTSNEKINHTAIQSFVNRAPLTSVQVASNYLPQQDALIACSGQGEYGALSIITFGIETSALTTSEKSEWRGISQCWSFSSMKDQSPFLVTSSLLDTRILSAKDGHIDDVTARIRIKSDTETLHIAPINTEDRHFLLQVCSDGVAVITLDNLDIEPMVWEPQIDIGSSIVFATSCKKNNSTLLALCAAFGDVFLVQVLDITYVNVNEGLTVREVSRRMIQSCPSYFSFLELQSRVILTIGTFDSSLVFYSTELQLLQEINLACSPGKEFSVPNSVGILKSAHSNQSLYMIVGLKQGDLLSFKVNDDLLLQETLIQRKQPYLHAIGSQPVKIFPCSRNGVYALSEQLWRLSCSDRDHIDLEQVLLPRFRNSIDTIACFDADLPLLRQTGEPLAVFADKKLHIFQLGLKSKINTNKIQLGQTPQKVLYDKTLNYLVATTITVEAGRRKNYMQLLDPSSGKCLSNLEPLGLDLDYGQNSAVLSMTEWTLKNNNKTYKYLCIGLGHTEEEAKFTKSARTWKPKKETGSLILFRLKTRRNGASSFSLKKIWTLEKLHGGVHSVCPHSAGLLFSAGRHIYLYRLDSVTGKLIEIAHKHLLSKVTSIHGDGERICVTSHNNESIAFFRVDDEHGKLVFLKSDSEFRSIHHSLVIDQRLAIGVSQSGGMVALYDNLQAPHEERLDCLFSFHYSDILVSPSLALLGTQSDAFHNQAKQFFSHILPWNDMDASSTQSKQQNQAEGTRKPIVSCTISGGIVHVYRISSQLYQLLKVLQGLLLAFEPTKPLLSSSADFVDYYCQLSGGEKATIHGDIVEMFLKLSFDEQLRLVSAANDQIKPELGDALRCIADEADGDRQIPTVDYAVVFIRDILLCFSGSK